MKPQCERLLDALRRAPITTLEAQQKLGIGRVAARVLDLKNLGYVITSEPVSVRNRFGERCKVARYTLVQANAKKAA